MSLTSCPYMSKLSFPPYWRASPPIYRLPATHTRTDFSRRHLTLVLSLNHALTPRTTTKTFPSYDLAPEWWRLLLSALPRFVFEPSPCME